MSNLNAEISFLHAIALVRRLALAKAGNLEHSPKLGHSKQPMGMRLQTFTKPHLSTEAVPLSVGNTEPWKRQNVVFASDSFLLSVCHNVNGFPNQVKNFNHRHEQWKRFISTPG